MNLPIANISPAENFRIEWQELRNVERDRDRASLLRADQKEVMHEMIYQECLAGKTHQKIADEYPVNKSTVWRISSRRKKDGNPLLENRN